MEGEKDFQRPLGMCALLQLLRGGYIHEYWNWSCVCVCLRVGSVVSSCGRQYELVVSFVFLSYFMFLFFVERMQ